MSCPENNLYNYFFWCVNHLQMPLLLFPAVYIPSQARIISQGHTYWTLVEQTAQEAYIRMAISFLREIVYSYLYFPRFLISTHNRIYNTVVQHYTEAAL